MAMRMTGLASGLDTESMVKELVSASSEKVNKIKQKKQDVEWKKEIWSGLNTKIYNFYKTELSAFKTVSSYNAKKAVASDETKVSVSVGANASNGTHSVFHDYDLAVRIHDMVVPCTFLDVVDLVWLHVYGCDLARLVALPCEEQCAMSLYQCEYLVRVQMLLHCLYILDQQIVAEL